MHAEWDSFALNELTSSWGPASVTAQWKDFPEQQQQKTHKRNYLPTYLPYYARDEVRTKTLTTTTTNQQQQYSYSQQQQQEQQQKDEKIL